MEEELKIETEGAQAEGEEAQGGDTPADEQAQAEELVVSIGEEVAGEEGADAQPAPAWVKKVRERNRELERELRETKRKLNEAAPQKAPDLGPKPTLADFDYDESKYEQSLATWMEQKKKADDQKAAEEAQAKTDDEKWQARLRAYQQGKATINVSDFEDAEAVVTDHLSVVQQSIIVKGSSNAPTFIYALGKNEAKLKELAAITDPVEFAFAAAKMEATQLKVTKKPATQPEGGVSGDAGPSGAVNNTLEKLRAEAEKTGDYTKVNQYKRQQRAAGK